MNDHPNENSQRRITVIPATQTINAQAALRQKKVAAYCRVSTEEEEQQSSYEAQCSYYTDKILSNQEWTMAGIFADATVIIGLKQNPTIGRRFSPIFSFIGHLSGKYGRCYT